MKIDGRIYTCYFTHALYQDEQRREYRVQKNEKVLVIQYNKDIKYTVFSLRTLSVFYGHYGTGFFEFYEIRN